METQLDYGNWIRKKNLLILGLCTLGVGGLIFIPLGSLYQLVLIILFIIVLVSFLFPLYAYIMFSQQGGKFQEKVYNLIIQRLGPKVTGKILDIGSGNGVLAVKLAQQHSDVEVVGIDYWGKDWEYSQKVCEQNARITHVENRVHFQRGDAATLDFADNTFDGAISNLTFHEVADTSDKREVIQEALRVVKLGGKFAFQDLFLIEREFGRMDDLLETIRGWGIRKVEFVETRNASFIPPALKLPFMVGTMGILAGEK